MLHHLTYSSHSTDLINTLDENSIVIITGMKELKEEQKKYGKQLGDGVQEAL